MTAPKSLIINSPYAVPVQHWQQARDGGFGMWCWDVAFKEAQIHDIIEKHAK